MKIIIQGKDMTKKDLIEIGKFFTKFFKDRKDIVHLDIVEGTGDMSKQECLDMIIDMFQGKKHYFTIFDKRDGAYNDR